MRVIIFYNMINDYAFFADNDGFAEVIFLSFKLNIIELECICERFFLRWSIFALLIFHFSFFNLLIAIRHQFISRFIDGPLTFIV